MYPPSHSKNVPDTRILQFLQSHIQFISRVRHDDVTIVQLRKDKRLYEALSEY